MSEFWSTFILIHSEQEVPKKFYFDTAEVYDIAKGIESYRDALPSSNIIDWKRLYQHRNIVCALAYGGYLPGSIQLLPPHLAELFDGVKADFGVHDSDIMNRGLARLALSEFLEEQKFSNTESHRHQLQVIANLMLSEASWRHRINRIHSRGILKVTSEGGTNWNPYDGWEDDLYALQEAMNQWDSERGRPAKPDGNLKDAMAMVILFSRLADYNAKQVGELPIFYDPSGFFYDACASSGLLAKTLIIRDRRGEVKQECVLRRHDYFILSCALNRLRSASKKVFVELEDSSIDFEQFLHDFENLHVGSSDSKDGIGNFINGSRIEEDILSLFYEYVHEDVVKETAKQKKTEVLFAPIDLEDLIREKKRISSMKKELRSELSDHIRDIQRMVLLWKSIRNGSEKLARRIEDRQRHGKSIDIIRDFGLMRYGLRSSIRERVEVLMGGRGILAEDGITGRVEFAQVEIFKSAVSGWLGNNLDGLVKTAVCLIMLREYELVIQMIPDDKFSDDFSLAILKAVAYISHDTEGSKVQIEGIANWLRENIVVGADSEPNMRIGLTYALYYLVPSAERFNRKGAAPSTLYRSVVQEMIVNVCKAYRLFSEHRWGERTIDLCESYALNGILFCAVELGDVETFNTNASEAVLAMYDILESRNKIWHPRFEDTLARYHYRLSIAAAEPTVREQNLKEAIKLADRASIGDLDNEDAPNFHRFLATKLAIRK